MPAILKSDISAISAAQFVNNLINSDSNIYIGVGRDSSYPWTNENVPPTPIDNITDETDFREKLIGIKKVSTTDVMIMIPKVQWSVGMTFDVLSETDSAPKRATNYYCITSNNYVYQCIGKSASGIVTTAGAEPDLKLASVTTIDGYTWKFLYNITTQMVNAGMVLDDWIPVPYNKHGVYPGGTITEDQHSYGDVNANYTLGAYRVLINVTLGNEGTAIPYDTEYRQIGILYDPLDSDGDFISGDNYSKSEFNYESGSLFFLENRRTTTRNEGQSETLQCLLSF